VVLKQNLLLTFAKNSCRQVIRLHEVKPEKDSKGEREKASKREKEKERKGEKDDIF